MAKSKDRQRTEEYEKAQKAVASLNDDLKRLQKTLADIQADPWADPFADVKTISAEIDEITKKLNSASKERQIIQEYEWAEEAKRRAENMAEIERQAKVELAVLAEIEKEKAKAAATATKEREKAAAETARQLEDVRRQAEKDESDAEKLRRDQYAAAASAMKRFYAEEEKERKAAEKAQADADKQRKQSAKDFQELAKELFWTARYGGVGGLAQMGLSRLIGGMLGGGGSGAGAAGSAGGAAGSAAGGLGSAAAALGPAAAVVGAVVGAGLAIKHFGETVYAMSLEFGKFVSPGTMTRHQMAVEDLSAAIGVMLIPVVERATAIIDRLNVLFTGMQGRVTPLVDKVAMAVEAFAGAFIKIAAAISESPAFRAAINYFSDLAIAAVKLVDSFMLGAAMMLEVIDRLKHGRIAAALDFHDVAEAARATLDRLGSGGTTIAARPAQMTTIERVGEEARLAAWGARGMMQLQQASLDESRRQTVIQSMIFGVLQASGSQNPAGGGGGSGGGYGNDFVNAVYAGWRMNMPFQW